MSDTEKTDRLVARAGEQLFQFAIDRGDMNIILAGCKMFSHTLNAVREYLGAADPQQD
jgi:hypothetical protein